jgi:hypothetical protein
MTAHEFIAFLAACGRADEATAQLAKLGFTPEFVAQNVLSGAGTVTVSHVAMLWQGMPNKHDRKRTRLLFDMLSELGLLSPSGDDETWTVVSVRAT